jgi:sugar phosphate permease
LHLKFPKIFYGWWIIVACFVISLFQGGFIILGFTAFFEPISNDLGWSYTQLSFAISLRGVEAGILAPFIGLFVDRRGPRWLMFGGTLLVGISLLAISRASSLGLFYGAFLLLAFGMSGLSPPVFMTAVANWFRKRVGLASGIINSGFALGGLLVPLVILLIDTVDWRNALVILALIMCTVGLPLSLVLRHKPEQYGLMPDGEKSDHLSSYQEKSAKQIAEMDFTLRQALGNRAFWHIGLAMAFHFAAIGAYVTHVMPSLASVGIDRSVAGWIAMAVPLISISGRLGSGWLADRFNKKQVTIAFMVSSIMGLLFITYVSSAASWLIIPFAIFLGIGWGGTNTSRMSLIHEYFGRSKYGSIFGFQTGMTAVGMILGPLFAGWIFDTWGTYQPAWITFVVIVIVALIIMATTPQKISKN